jgi:hypothetical protein
MIAPRSASTTPLIDFNNVGAQQRDDLTLVEFEIDSLQNRSSVVSGVHAAHQQQLGPTLASIEENFGTCRGRLPHLCDVVHDHAADRALDQSPDDEERNHHEHANADGHLIGDPSDQRKNEQTRNHPERRHRKTGRAGSRRNGE